MNEKRTYENIRPSELINMKLVSEILSGNPDYLRKDWVENKQRKIPKKYRRLVLSLYEIVEAWLLEVEDYHESKK